MDAIRRLGVHQRNANTLQEAERDKTLFSIAKPIILERESEASKDFLSVDESKPWSLRFFLRLASLHVNLIRECIYIP